jgi:putative tricarboxylic transport membrane protein
VRISPAILAPLIFAIAFIGAYSIGGAISDVVVMLVVGVIGYFMRKFNFPLIPLIIALVLGEMVEVSLRRALIVSDNGFLIFLTDPISATLLGLGALSLVYTIVQDIRGVGRTP